MSFVYSLFLKRAGEELSQFDNRISNMLPVAAGLVFFDMRNYRNDNGEFNVYIEWNEELNSILNDRLPSGGYFIKARKEPNNSGRNSENRQDSWKKKQVEFLFI